MAVARRARACPSPCGLSLTDHVSHFSPLLFCFRAGHGAGRAMSRNKSRRALDYKEVLEGLAEKGISIRVASPKLVMEEAPESYKDVTQVVETCTLEDKQGLGHAAGLVATRERAHNASSLGPALSLWRLLAFALSLGHNAGISKKCIKLRPIAVVKG